MKVFQRQDDLGQVEAGRVLHEDALALQVHEELAAREVLQNQVQLAARLERVHQVHNKRVLEADGGVRRGLLRSIHLLIGSRKGASQDQRNMNEHTNQAHATGADQKIRSFPVAQPGER